MEPRVPSANTSSHHWAGLDAEWDLDQGFIGRLRQGRFDPEGYERLLDVLRSIDAPDGPTLDRRLVELVWMLPDVIDWHIDPAVGPDGAAAPPDAAGLIRSEVERILGVP